MADGIERSVGSGDFLSEFLTKIVLLLIGQMRSKERIDLQDYHNGCSFEEWLSSVSFGLADFGKHTGRNNGNLLPLIRRIGLIQKLYYYSASVGFCHYINPPLARKKEWVIPMGVLRPSILHRRDSITTLLYSHI